MAPFLLGTRSKRRKTADAAAAAGGPGRAEKRQGAGLYHCDYCHCDVSQSIRIRCAECPDFDLCVDCFRVGAQVGGHRSDHSYRVVDSLSFPLYEPGWGADDELLLLEALEQCGLHAWPRVAQSLGRSPEEVRAHYERVYVDVPSFPLPRATTAMEAVDVRALIAQRRERRSDGPGLKREEEAGVKKESSPGVVKKELDARLPLPARAAPVAETQHSQQGKTAAAPGAEAARHATTAGKAPPPQEGAAPAPFSRGGAASSPPKSQPSKQAGGAPGSTLAAGEAQQTGYHVKRCEFDPEWDNGAEALLADLSLEEGDSEEDTAAKLRLVEMYNRRLDARQARREFVLARGLLNVRRQQGLDRRRSPAEREVAARLRVIARHLPADQHEALVEGLLAEGRLRARVAELQDYRALGLRTFQQVDELELVLAAGGDVLAAGLAGKPAAAGRAATAAEDVPAAAGDGAPSCSTPATPRTSALPPPPPEASSGSLGTRQLALAAMQALSRRAGPSGAAAALARQRAARVPVDEAALARLMLCPTLDFSHAAAALQGAQQACEDWRGGVGLAAWRARRGVLLDLDSLPDHGALEAEEVALCAQERYLPAQYLAIKAAAMGRLGAAGALEAADMPALPFDVDAARIVRLHAFFVERGWVPRSGGGGQAEEEGGKPCLEPAGF